VKDARRSAKIDGRQIVREVKDGKQVPVAPSDTKK